MQANNLRVAVLLTIQAALLGAIGPDVRKILCRWNVSEIRVACTASLNMTIDDQQT